MAKKGLGRGVGALLGEAKINPDEIVSGEAAVTATPVKPKGGLHNFSLKKDNLPSGIEIDENNCLWIDPTLLKPNPHHERFFPSFLLKSLNNFPIWRRKYPSVYHLKVPDVNRKWRK